MTSDYEKTSFIAFTNLFAENISSSLTYKIKLPKKHSIISTLPRKAKTISIKENLARLYSKTSLHSEMIF